jgi:hypothetical protein
LALLLLLLRHHLRRSRLPSAMAAWTHLTHPGRLLPLAWHRRATT